MLVIHPIFVMVTKYLFFQTFTQMAKFQYLEVFMNIKKRIIQQRAKNLVMSLPLLVIKLMVQLFLVSMDLILAQPFVWMIMNVYRKKKIAKQLMTASVVMKEMMKGMGHVFILKKRLRNFRKKVQSGLVLYLTIHGLTPS